MSDLGVTGTDMAICKMAYIILACMQLLGSKHHDTLFETADCSFVGQINQQRPLVYASFTVCPAVTRRAGLSCVCSCLVVCHDSPSSISSIDIRPSRTIPIHSIPSHHRHITVESERGLGRTHVDCANICVETPRLLESSEASSLVSVGSPES